MIQFSNFAYRTTLTTLFGLVIISLISCSEERVDPPVVDTDRQLEYSAVVDILNSDGESVVTINAAVADDEMSRSEGLMGVSELPEDHGMIFIFEEEEERSFWMANTPLSLDLLFINGEMEIVHIFRNAPAFSQESIPSQYPAKYVVETIAGYTIRYDIVEGMKIDYRIN
ncbi:MAG: DUF192 domain-containing protein [Balneolaceae bacterium]